MSPAPYIDDRDPLVRLTRAEKAIAKLQRRPQLPGDGLYAPPTTQNKMGTGSVNIAPGADWDASFTGSTMFDLTDPTEPAIIDSGIYAFAVQLDSGDLLRTGGYYSAEIILDNAGTGSPSQLLWIGPGDNTKPIKIPLSITWYMAAGMTFKVSMQDRQTGVVVTTIALNLAAQRIT